ncbi:hypothetical protein FVE67_08525 [Thermosulfurimonas marina]|uniref:CRISPR system Cms protein Csm4 n=1 Tax=Thermosulfurimonas marina TaxID=2047767 RepID=A0A6H1WUG8_9BACT|nr:hypothetical protein [Thermosulfurimonas marina]QJA06830.1 hypothetical protein FVE67_08525 [Thermosulfurimonas marina]
MKLAEIVIRPLGPLGTSLKGDTIFGHFFWQLVFDPELIKGDLEHWRRAYEGEPFVVFSSAFPRLEREGRSCWLLPRPTLPVHFFLQEDGDCFEVLTRRKEEKKRRYMLVSGTKVNLREVKFLKPAEAVELFWKDLEDTLPEKPPDLLLFFPQSHNSLNRLSFSTGEGFAPYQVENHWYLPGLRLAILALFREEALDKESLAEAFRRMGEVGFGRDASAGLGRFEVEDLKDLPLPEPSPTLYTLAPYIPAPGEYEKIWYQPFVRFGRHGGPLALSENPFKEPVLMAQEGAVLKTSNPSGPYVGRAVSGLSKAEKRALHQGYSLVFPLEGFHESPSP